MADSEIGWSIKDQCTVLGDGRCFFRSLVVGIAKATGQPKFSKKQETTHADALRWLAYAEMTGPRFKELSSRNVVEGDYNEHCMSMRSETFFGGEVQALVLAECLGIEINIHVREAGRPGGIRNIVQYGENAEKEIPLIRVGLLYNGVNHYDPLIKK